MAPARRIGRAVAARTALLAICLAGPQATALAQARPPFREEAIVLVRSLNSLRATRGTGFAVGDGSWIVTASHVVAVDLGKGKRLADRTVLVYSGWTGRPHEAQVAAVDAAADIALLRAPGLAGHPSLPVEGLGRTDAEPALQALRDRPLRLCGFPLTFGEGTVAALARPENHPSRLREIARRGDTNLCVLGIVPGAQPGWSGGPILAEDSGAVVGVFHSLYRPGGEDENAYPAGSLSGYLAPLFRSAGADPPAGLESPREPSLARNPDSLELLAAEMRSLSWSAAGRRDRAAEDQREILKKRPEDVHARVELGRILAVDRPEEALPLLREAAALQPAGVMPRLTLARVEHAAYESAAALKTLTALIQQAPDEIEPRLALAEIRESLGQLEQAEAALNDALERSPQHPIALLRLGQLKARQGKVEAALRTLGQASDLSTADRALAQVPLAYARALEGARKFKEAESAYRQSLRLDPENAIGHYYLAQFFLRQRRIDDAQLQLNTAIRLKNLSDEMLEALRALQLKINERGGG